MSANKGKRKKPVLIDSRIYPKDLPEFSEYVQQKYDVNLEEDLVVMIEDLIERQRQMNGMEKNQ